MISKLILLFLSRIGSVGLLMGSSSSASEMNDKNRIISSDRRREVRVALLGNFIFGMNGGPPAFNLGLTTAAVPKLSIV